MFEREALLALTLSIVLAPAAAGATAAPPSSADDPQTGDARVNDTLVCNLGTVDGSSEATYVCAPMSTLSDGEQITIGEETPLAGAEITLNASDGERVEAPITGTVYESESEVRPSCDTGVDDPTEACKIYTNNVPPHFWDLGPAEAPEENPLPVDVPGVPVALLLQYPEQLPNVVIGQAFREVDSQYPDDAPVQPNDLPVQLLIPMDPTLPDDHPLRTEKLRSGDADDAPDRSETSDDGADSTPTDEGDADTSTADSDAEPSTPSATPEPDTDAPTATDTSAPAANASTSTATPDATVDTPTPTPERQQENEDGATSTASATDAGGPETPASGAGLGFGVIAALGALATAGALAGRRFS